MQPPPAHAVGAVAGLVVDTLVGEPPDAVHPMVGIGRVLQGLEARSYRDSRAAGVVHLTTAVAGTAGVAWTLRCLLGPTASTAVIVAVAGAGSMLADTAAEVGDLLSSDDLAGARTAVRALVGRDPTTLDEAEVVRAVVESVAENTVDAVTATIFWAGLLGPVGAAVHRTVNTLDAMVGHRSERYRRFGWAAARTDDWANWLPARLTAAAVALVGPAPAAEVWRTVRRDGPNHPSPNGGVVEAAFAAALGVTLGGTNTYGGITERRGPLGSGPPPSAEHIAAAVSLSRRTTWALAWLPLIVHTAALGIERFGRRLRWT